MSDEAERRAKLDSALAEMRQNLDVSSRVDDLAAGLDGVREEVRVLADRFVEHTHTTDDDKAEILREIQAIPDRAAERMIRELKRRRDDTPAPPVPSRVSREMGARAARAETSSADLAAPAAAPSAVAPARTAGDDLADISKGSGLLVGGARGMWARFPRWIQSAIVAVLVAAVTSALWAMGCGQWAQKLNEIRIDVPPRDMGMPWDLAIADKRPAPPPAPPEQQKPKRPGKPRPKPSDGDAQVDPIRQPEERRHLDCQPGPRPLDPLLCPRDAKPRPPGEW